MSQRVHPIDPQAVYLRIRSLVDMHGGPAAVAREAGMPLSTLETYVGGKNLPGAMALAQLSRAFAVSTDFLLFGEGR